MERIPTVFDYERIYLNGNLINFGDDVVRVDSVAIINTRACPNFFKTSLSNGYEITIHKTKKEYK